jgi:hypothetical protein
MEFFLFGSVGIDGIKTSDRRFAELPSSKAVEEAGHNGRIVRFTPRFASTHAIAVIAGIARNRRNRKGKVLPLINADGLLKAEPEGQTFRIILAFDLSA